MDLIGLCCANHHHGWILLWHRISLLCPYCYVLYGAEVLPITHFLSLSHHQAVQGTGLAFIVYSEAIKNMEVPQLYSVLYFFMLLMLGIGSMLGNTAAILTPLTDSRAIATRFPKEVISGERPPWQCRPSARAQLCCPTAVEGSSLTPGGAGSIKHAAQPGQHLPLGALKA